MNRQGIAGSAVRAAGFGALGLVTFGLAVGYFGPTFGNNARAAAAACAIGLGLLTLWAFRRGDAGARGQRVVLLAGVLFVLAGGAALLLLVGASAILSSVRD